MGRGVIIGLTLSIALNVFAVGFISGRIISDDKTPPPISMGRGDSPFGLMRHASVLPPESREAFRDIVRAELPSMRDRRRQTHVMRRELAELIAAPEFDREAVKAKMTELDALQSGQRSAFNDAFVNALATLSAEDRRLLVEQAGKHRNRHGHERRKQRREHWRDE